MSSFKEYYFPHIGESEWNNYFWQLKNCVKTLKKLRDYSLIDEDELYKLKGLRLKFSITPYFLSLIDPKDKSNPIKKQCIPSIEEVFDEDGEVDPLNDLNNMVLPNVIKKYPDRVLILVTNICPLYCRYCFRRNILGKKKFIITPSQIDSIFYYLKKERKVKEVIISGGEPLILSNDLIEYILRGLRKIENIEVIRIGTRVPVVLPQRIEKDFLKIIRKYSPIWFVTHFNHPFEVTEDSKKAVSAILSTGSPVLNQTVLLKNVNDDEKVIEELFRKLIKIGIKPYYLFGCDPVRGASHFRTSLKKGMKILEHLNGRLSGIGQPIFAIDTKGGGKIPIQPNYIVSIDGERILVKNYENRIYEYRERKENNWIK